MNRGTEITLKMTFLNYKLKVSTILKEEIRKDRLKLLLPLKWVWAVPFLHFRELETWLKWLEFQ